MVTELQSAETAPVALDLPNVEIPRGEVLKRLGYPSASIELQEPVQSMFDDALREAGGLMRPRAAYRALRVESNDGDTVRFNGSPFAIASGQVAKLLARSKLAVCFAVTVGSALDETISGRMRNGDMLAAVILDAIGSETADAAADELHWKIISRSAEAGGLSVTPRFSPGYGDWPLTVQKDLLAACGGDLIGIAVTPSSLMIPRKSVSAVFGLRGK
jgi:hypothetical protein